MDLVGCYGLFLMRVLGGKGDQLTWLFGDLGAVWMTLWKPTSTFS